MGVVFPLPRVSSLALLSPALLFPLTCKKGRIHRRRSTSVAPKSTEYHLKILEIRTSPLGLSTST